MMLLARYALILPAIAMLAVYIPMLFDAGFGQREARTHMFYSPVSKKFIWRDTLLEPKKDKEKTHHARFLQMDQSGATYTRQEFERMLPFIYYKNMELWGLLPITLNGRTFDKNIMKAERQVLELLPEQVAGQSPNDEVYPLIESAPDIARLVFPEDRFRLGNEMEFVNADTNKRDGELTRRFTTALRDKGFRFPGRLVAGKHTVLKPFDDGVFLLDAAGAVFHVKRVHGHPDIVRTPIDPALNVRSMKISENSRREFHGLLLTEDNRLFLIGYDDYALTPIPIEGYNPDTMRFKLIINPLYRTAVYSDHATIRAVAMDADCRPVARYEHAMPGASMTTAQYIFTALVPFRLSLDDPDSGYMGVVVRSGFRHAALAMSLALALYALLIVRRPQRQRGIVIALDALLVLATGLYGLTAVALLPHEG